MKSSHSSFSKSERIDYSRPYRFSGKQKLCSRYPPTATSIFTDKVSKGYPDSECNNFMKKYFIFFNHIEHLFSVTSFHARNEVECFTARQTGKSEVDLLISRYRYVSMTVLDMRRIIYLLLYKIMHLSSMCI